MNIKVNDKVMVTEPNSLPRYGKVISHGKSLVDVLYHRNYRHRQTEGNYFTTRDLVDTTYVTILTDEEYDECLVVEKLIDDY